MKIFYKPVPVYLIFDILILVLSIFVLLEWFPLTTATPYEKYDEAAVYYCITWVISSYFFGRYLPIKKRNYFDALFQIFYVSLFVFGLLWALSNIFTPGRYSINVLLTYTLGIFILNYLFFGILYAWLYAVEYEIIITPPQVRENAQLKNANYRDEDSFNELCSAIEEYSGLNCLNFLKQKFDLKSGNTKVLFSTNFFDLKSIANYQYSTIIHLPRLNDIRGINKLFSVLNEKLADDGSIVCCFESKSTHKKNIFDNYPPLINSFIYLVDYLFRRVMPKIHVINKLYFYITQGKNRIISKTEVFGRLYCCGYEIVGDKKIGKLNYTIAHRIKQPESFMMRTYGPFIKLRRFGKNGKMFNVYKMRTMHPYSEYLQKYIYDNNQLSEGGKFNRDVRINTIGRFLRKYWLDELPMLLNLVKGDLKIVGVRPLSSQYFSLYSKELQDKRIKFKPGLLPPFYADMPGTLDEIQASEMKYLVECETKGVYKTDFKYFFLIIKTIIFKKARSA